MTRSVAASMAEAAQAWLDSLRPDQLTEASWSFPADDERRRWYYTPTDHGGLALRAMDDRQQQLAFRLLGTGMSRGGYVAATAVMQLEAVLDLLEGWPRGPKRGRLRDPLLYQFRVFGSPGDDAWSWRVGGHHLSVHLTVVEGEVVSGTPSFLGADPAASPLLGPQHLRPLGALEDLARELVRSFDDAQRSRAVISPVPPIDIVTGNRSTVAEGDMPLPLSSLSRSMEEGMREIVDDAQRKQEEQLGLSPAALERLRYRASASGLPSASMTPPQRDLLDALIDCYLHRLADDIAQREAARLDRTKVTLAWAGPTEPGAPHYYRLQGPRLLIEYDNTQRDANHVHAVWRNPDGDFGVDALTAHYAQHH